MAADMSDSSAISIRDLSFSYDAQVVLEDVNLEVLSLDSICVVGPNGGGKSTLIKLIVGLLNPDSGEVRVFGEKPESARLRIGYVPQYARYDPQFPISVFEVVCMGRLSDSWIGRYTRDDREKVMEALSIIGLADIADRPFSSISGGQRQRVLIARALASEGDILILDEPTANIDHESEVQFFDLLTELNKRMTILMVTHEVGFASTFFKRIACVNKQVVIHPTSALTGDLIRDMYGGDLQIIRHDHFCGVEGHQHD
ncbi:ATPase component of Mn/Zn ABC-type transporter [Desulfocapsa sulfexigens DSM 10523]|uniref:ATPase component of Mn/Zn ABC-type transporter n=1 Tax=Desulfocapsa sulfexigens (strain DSM 10523 / SB164P1) TaxID=1167006 RepID=M1P9S9_DESSD|nr:ABC transporter ATP-binding protein [Desulfocapsa sulfexigens]AGF78402.1 ATPase component of Mn/Zn ABC-type transporter [Desulfocapsa sulfexigens DSM 10523]